MKKIALILLALAAAIPSAAAQTSPEWRRASLSGEPGHRRVILVDAGTVQRDGKTIAFRMIEIVEVKGPKDEGDFSTQQYRVDCRKHSSWFLRAVVYDQGKFAVSYSGARVEMAEKPGTPMYEVIDAVCERRYLSDPVTGDPEAETRRWFRENP